MTHRTVTRAEFLADTAAVIRRAEICTDSTHALAGQTVDLPEVS